MDVEPTPMDKLSRPAELVQRAKQLAQLTNLQFGRNAVPAAPAVGSPVEAAPADPTRFDIPSSEPAPRIEPSPRIEPLPRMEPSRVEPAARVEPIPATPVISERPVVRPAVIEQAAVLGSPANGGSLALSVSRGNLHLGSRIEEDVDAEPVAIAQAPASRSMSSAEEELADSFSPMPTRVVPANGNGNGIGNSHSAGKARSGGNGPSDGNNHVGGNGRPGGNGHAIKPAGQKVDEFYGVRKVGEEVIFAARFERAKKVLIAGDFNNWSPMSTPMISRGGAGEFYMSLPLPKGRYRYRFVVDGKWMTDPHNKYVEVNQFGELNNVIEVE
jgi:hypothetical protein